MSETNTFSSIYVLLSIKHTNIKILFWFVSNNVAILFPRVEAFDYILNTESQKTFPYGNFSLFFSSLAPARFPAAAEG